MIHLGSRQLLRSNVQRSWLSTSTRLCAPNKGPNDAVSAARIAAFKKRVGYTDPPVPITTAEQVPSYGAEQVHVPPIGSHIWFLAGFGILSFSGAAYYSHCQTDELVRQIRSAGSLSTFFSQKTVSRQTLESAHKHATAAKLGRIMQKLINTCHRIGLPQNVTQSIGQGYLTVAEWYLNLSSGKQVVVPVIAVNTLVFGAWAIANPLARNQVRARMGRWMVSNFMHRPTSAHLYPMLYSTFSHRSALHFGFNNFALWSIGGSALVYAAAASDRGQRKLEASHTPEFLAFFAIAGVFAATVSHVASAVRFRRIASLHGVTAAVQAVGRQRSLGASGAVYAALVMTACAIPDSRVSLILLPFFSVPIGVGVSGLVALDALGILLRWKVFDHWAHLGGALFGFLYFHLGTPVYAFFQTRVVNWILYLGDL